MLNFLGVACFSFLQHFCISEETVEQRAVLKQRMDAFRENDEKIQKKLDQVAEELEDRFSDIVHVVQYDSVRLEKKFLPLDSKRSFSLTPCSAERANIVSCLHDQNQSACKEFVDMFSACSNNLIANS